MNKKQVIRSVSVAVCGAMCLSLAVPFAGCGAEKDSLVLMTEELSGLFNPYYATSGTDMDVVGLTQVSMLSTDNTGKPVAGDTYPTVVKDYEIKRDEANDKTIYEFVIKNGIKFSDDKPLTMNDVMFNIYENLDPVYTGSSTMYSIDIEGLKQYRTQTNLSGDNDVESEISSQAAANATLRILELIDLYEDVGRIDGSLTSFSADEEKMRAAILEHEVTSGYMDAVATEKQQATYTQDDYRKMLIADYDLTLETFKKELDADFAAAKESYDTTTAPYSDWANELKSDIFKFFLYEGYITPVYEKVNGRDNKSKIEKFENTGIVNSYSTQEAAVNRVYNDNVKTGLNNILSYWGTAGTLSTIYTGAAKEVILKNTLGDGETLLYPNITGIVSLGHTTQESKVTINNVQYTVAHNHNADGTVQNDGEYDVLRITVNGSDPKAIYNFGFTVAPAHYYTADDEHPDGRTIDIASNKFGVEYASSNFQSKTIQSQQHVEVPMGAGPYVATDDKNADNPKGSAFWSSNVVYYKANTNFMFPVKTEKVRLKVTSSSNALDALQNNEVDYATPQFTKTNAERLDKMTKSNYTRLDAWQLGYGYIGINAGKVPNINIRKAIMAAMDASLAIDYYQPGTCAVIDWPMSNRSWAYPYAADGVTSKSNGKDYLQWTNKQAAEQKVLKYMAAAGVSAGSSDLKITFTIAGASITDHPTFKVFKQAQEILNELGWNVEIKADSQALTKLSTGSLQVWAAAWGSTIDPDMYQVYHKNSTATSVYAWGYREILGNTTQYSEEYAIITELSGLIEDARSVLDEATRKPMYEKAMGMVLDLAVEMPVYQRKNLYAFNNKRVTGFPEQVNEYSSPLEKIWELELHF